MRRSVSFGHLPIEEATVDFLSIIGVSWERGRNIVFRQPELLVSACEPTHPHGRKPTAWLMQNLTTLKIFWYEAIVGNLGNEVGKALQDEHREDTRDEAVRNIERDYSKPRLYFLVKVRWERLRRTRNEDNGQEARKSISLSKSISFNNCTHGGVMNHIRPIDIQNVLDHERAGDDQGATYLLPCQLQSFTWRILPTRSPRWHTCENRRKKDGNKERDSCGYGRDAGFRTISNAGR